MKAELRKEYEEIRSRAIQGLCVPANQVTVGTVIDAVREAVTACQELADRPPRGLTDAEIDFVHKEWLESNPKCDWQDLMRDAIAAHIAKQREPQVVKFRAARNREDGQLKVVQVDLGLNEYWEWLEPAQEFEVRT